MLRYFSSAGYTVNKTRSSLDSEHRKRRPYSCVCGIVATDIEFSTHQ